MPFSSKGKSTIVVVFPPLQIVTAPSIPASDASKTSISNIASSGGQAPPPVTVYKNVYEAVAKFEASNIPVAAVNCPDDEVSVQTPGSTPALSKVFKSNVVPGVLHS